MIITLDGPSGSGKSTLAKRLAKVMNFTHIDSGSIYRAIAYYFITNGVTSDNYEKSLEDINISYSKNGVMLDGKRLKSEIRTVDVTELSSKIATYPFVRNYVDNIIKEIAANTSVVVDGRDIGSSVLPNADFKFYIEADIQKRAARRILQIKRKNPESDIVVSEVREDLKIRDDRDKNREYSPLCIPENAIIIDTTNDSVKESLQKITRIIRGLD
ncbi:MAG: (d)CMP kinase [Ezakiella sp.]|uniref:(d)CMP kinase n=1 Tax=Ezakiella sp. TaxID=1935205 RepID=UPI0029749F49|nr:(d)CMP kinase [Ezakiella sp.]MDD7730952.1 (d)CMP kinase [Eubacteriales bacterium]MDY6079410.1 (d)CMP kinase [Ezakiella sp.]